MKPSAHNKKLAEIADIRSGHPFRGTIEPDNHGDVYVVQARDTDITGEIFKDEMIKTTLTTKKQPDWLQPGDIVFIAKGARHYAALVENLPEQTVCTPHFFVVRLKPALKSTITPEFLCWQLNQSIAQRYFKVNAEGSLYLSIRRQVLELTPIRVLPLNKQTQLTAMHRCAVSEQKALQRLMDNRRQQMHAIAKTELTAK